MGANKEIRFLLRFKNSDGQPGIQGMHIGAEPRPYQDFTSPRSIVPPDPPPGYSYDLDRRRIVKEDRSSSLG